MQITIREPGSAITHFIGMMLAVFAAVPLLVKAGVSSGGSHFAAMAVFMASMILLYGASAAYHSVNLTGRYLRIFRKLDHMMIFVLIAGSYTPVCLIVLGGDVGYTMLALVWGIAVAGMLVKACWITCPKWFSSVIYIAMGWVCCATVEEREAGSGRVSAPSLCVRSSAGCWIRCAPPPSCGCWQEDSFIRRAALSTP